MPSSWVTTDEPPNPYIPSVWERSGEMNQESIEIGMGSITPITEGGFEEWLEIQGVRFAGKRVLVCGNLVIQEARKMQQI